MSKAPIPHRFGEHIQSDLWFTGYVDKRERTKIYFDHAGILQEPFSNITQPNSPQFYQQLFVQLLK